MHIRNGDPDTAFVLVLLNGDLIGCVVEADSKAGYVIQQPTDNDLKPTGEPIRREGRVDILPRTGIEENCSVCTWRDAVRAQLKLPSATNHHAECPNAETRS